MNSFIRVLLSFSKQKRTPIFRIVSLIAGAILFLIIIPAILLPVARIIDNIIPIEFSLMLETLISITSIPIGLFLLIWAVGAQWVVGKGTPAPIAPTHHLVEEGPYKLCRNPIQLGVMLYYLGLGTTLESLMVGLIFFLVAFGLGSLYHRSVEEKELRQRFGEEYELYKQRTPFLFPRLPYHYRQTLQAYAEKVKKR